MPKKIPRERVFQLRVVNAVLVRASLWRRSSRRIAFRLAQALGREFGFRVTYEGAR